MRYSFSILKFLTTIVCNIVLLYSIPTLANTENQVIKGSVSLSPNKIDEKNLEGIEVEFDYQGYERERTALYRYFIAREGIDEYHPIQEGEIGIFLYDLSTSLEKAVLVYLKNQGFCGTAGCDFKIFKLVDGELAGEILSGLNVQEHLRVLSNKSLEYHDLLFYDRFDEPLSVWQWEGTHYKLTKSFSKSH